MMAITDCITKSIVQNANKCNFKFKQPYYYQIIFDGCFVSVKLSYLRAIYCHVYLKLTWFWSIVDWYLISDVMVFAVNLLICQNQLDMFSISRTLTKKSFFHEWWQAAIQIASILHHKLVFTRVSGFTFKRMPRVTF